MYFHTIYIDGVFYKKNSGDEVFIEIVPTHDEHDDNYQYDFQDQSVKNWEEKFGGFKGMRCSYNIVLA